MSIQRALLSCRAEEGVLCLPVDALTTPVAASPQDGNGGFLRILAMSCPALCASLLRSQRSRGLSSGQDIVGLRRPLRDGLRNLLAVCGSLPQRGFQWVRAGVASGPQSNPARRLNCSVTRQIWVRETADKDVRRPFPPGPADTRGRQPRLRACRSDLSTQGRGGVM